MLLSNPLVRKPSLGAPLSVNTTDPLTRGMISCIPLLTGTGVPVDIMTRRHVNGGNASWSVAGSAGPSAEAWSFTNATTTDLAFSTAGSAFTVAQFCNVITVTPIATIGRWNYTSETVNTGWTMNIITSPGAAFVWDVNNNNGSANYQLASSVPATVGNHTIVGTSDGIGRRCIYVDGKFSGSTATNPTPLAATGDFSYPTSGNVYAYLVAVWNRDLSPFEVEAFHMNPMRLFTGTFSSGFISGVFGPGFGGRVPNLGPILAQ